MDAQNFWAPAVRNDGRCRHGDRIHPGHLARKCASGVLRPLRLPGRGKRMGRDHEQDETLARNLTPPLTALARRNRALKSAVSLFN